MRRKPLIVVLLQRYWRLSRGLTLGVSACVIDDVNRVKLAKTAEGLRQLPHGRVRSGETLEGALRRMLRDDYGIEVMGKCELSEISSDEPGLNAQKIGHFIVWHWRVIPTRARVATESISIDTLPPVSEVTRARLLSAVKHRAPSKTW